MSFMHHDPSDLGSLILIQITPKQCIILEDDTDTHMHVNLQITLAHIADILSVFFFFFFKDSSRLDVKVAFVQ